MAFRPVDNVLPNPAVPINLNDDVALSFGTSQDASLVWDTSDANANMFKLGLPAGDATNVPVFLMGIDSAVIGADLALLNGTTEPKQVMTSADASKWMSYGWNGVFFEFLGKDILNQILFNTPVNFNSTFIVNSNADIVFGTQGRIGGNSVIGTSDLRIGVQNDAPFVLCTALNQDVAFNAGTSANPKFYITSQTSFSTATDEWLAFSHDVTNAVLEVGSGLWDTSTTGKKVGVTTVNAATYDLLVTDYILNVTYTTTGAVTSLTLPSAQVVSGRVIIVKDAGGNAGTNNITIDTGGLETIDGVATATISTNYASVTLYSDGSNWFII